MHIAGTETYRGNGTVSYQVVGRNTLYVNVGETSASREFSVEGGLRVMVKDQRLIIVNGRNPMTVVAGLVPQAQVRHTFQVPAKEFSVQGGQYYTPTPTQHKYTCIADSEKAVKESDETNNERSELFNWP